MGRRVRMPHLKLRKHFLVRTEAVPRSNPRAVTKSRGKKRFSNVFPLFIPVASFQSLHRGLKFTTGSVGKRGPSIAPRRLREKGVLKSHAKECS